MVGVAVAVGLGVEVIEAGIAVEVSSGVDVGVSIGMDVRVGVGGGVRVVEAGRCRCRCSGRHRYDGRDGRYAYMDRGYARARSTSRGIVGGVGVIVSVVYG